MGSLNVHYNEHLHYPFLRPLKYIISTLLFLFLGGQVLGQCLSLPTAFNQKMQTAEKILEGRVVAQQSFIGNNGNIYTSNEVEVYRVFKGEVGFEARIFTEGGVVGDLMQVVTPSVKLKIGGYGVFSISQDQITEFVAIDERTGFVSANYRFTHREALYEDLARHVGSSVVELRRVPIDAFEPTAQTSRDVPSVAAVSPSLVTAGTKTILTIQGIGFGNEQRTGHVAFRNADDGGQSFVSLEPGPHYLSWTDTEIQLYVPSATLYNNTVAGTGVVRVTNEQGEHTDSEQQVTVQYAKSEVIYNENLNNTMLVGMQSGGYQFSMNQQLLSFLDGREMVDAAFEKWACNTKVNFELNHNVVNTSQWAHDDINLIGLSEPGQLPNYLLGKTITTFSGCGTPDGLQWNLVEVDIVLNRDINWYIGSDIPDSDQFDMATSILHELGHAHLLQHNNNQFSPMYFELLSGSSRRDLHLDTDIEGGTFIGYQAEISEHTCGEETHVLFDDALCNLSVINSVEDALENDFLVYPNPVESLLTISVPNMQGSTIKVYNLQGRVVLITQAPQSKAEINMSHLPSGIYLLELNTEQKRITKRLVKN